MSDGAFAVLSVAFAIVWGVFFYPPPAPSAAAPAKASTTVRASAARAPTPRHPVQPAIAEAAHNLALLDHVARPFAADR